MLCLGNPSSCRIARNFYVKILIYAMLSLASSNQGLVKYTCYVKIFLSLWTCVLPNKTTKLMKHLGGMEGMVYVEWLHKAHFYGLPCVSHLCKATQEQRDLRCHMLRSF